MSNPRGAVIVRARGLALGYADHEVIGHVDLEIRRGELWFLLGANGAGKTTFIHAVLGLIEPRSGSLGLDDEASARERVGFVPQQCAINPTLPTTVGEFVRLGLVGLSLTRSERSRRVAEATRTSGLDGMARRSYAALSGGLKRRALIARALVREPSLLLLDEPTAGLDPAAEHALLDLIVRLNREQAITVLFVSHDVQLAVEYASHVALFHGGRVAAGSTGKILTADSLERTYGHRIEPGAGHSRGDHR